MNPQRITSILFVHQQRIERCKVTVSSDNNLWAKIIRLFVNFQRFYLILYAGKSLYELGLWVHDLNNQVIYNFP